MPFLRGFAGVAGLLLMGGGVLEAQETPAPKPAESSAQTALASPIAVTLKRAIELALLNSKEIQVAKIQASVADHAAQITKAQFMPNLYAGSGAGYTNGMPETPGGRAPSVFNVTYTEQVLNEPLRGQAKELQEQAKAQKIALEEARSDVITRTAMAYLELAKVRHSLELLRAEQESAEKRAKEFRLKGEKRGYLPTLELVSIYSLLAKYNNYNLYFTHFQPNNFNAGIDLRVPIFSAQLQANIGLARVNLDAAKANLASKRTELTAEVRQKTRRVREMDAAKEVARLELQLAQQNVAVLQAQFGEGKLNLRDMERARLDENDKWMAYLDANFQRQQAQLDLLKAAGQLDKVWQ